MKKLGLALAGMLVVGLVSTARAEAPKKSSVLVNDFQVGKAVKTDGGVLGTSFCVELAKDPSLDVVCQSDISQLLTFAAQQALNGRSGGAQTVMRRLADVTHIVDGRVVQGKHGLILELKVSENVNRGDSESGPIAGDPIAQLKHKGIKGGISGVMDRFPALAKRTGAMLAPKASGVAAPPPELSKDK